LRRLLASGESAGPQPPAAPTGLAADAGDRRVTLSWKKNGESDLTGYCVYRGEAKAGPFQLQNAAPLKTNSLAQTGLANGKTYWFRVCAVNAAGLESAPSAPAAATPAAPAAATYTVRGRVTLDGKGLAGVSVSGGGASGATAADGSYVLERLAAGTHTVAASRGGYLFSAPQKVTVGPDRAGVDFTARAEETGLSVGGRVTVDGKPVAGVTVGWFNSKGKKTKTGDDGRYLLTGFEAGTYRLEAALDGYHFAPQEVTLTASRSDAHFRGERTYTISGRVVWAGEGAAGVTVAWYGSNGKKTKTDDDGNYVLAGSVAGAYRVEATKAGYRWAPQTVTVGPSRSGVDFIQAETYAISGRVTRKGRPVRGARVVVRGTGRQARTAANGTYRLDGLDAGTYVVVAKKAAMKFPKRTVTVGPSRSGVTLASRK
jgi:hypothetical protein